MQQPVDTVSANRATSPDAQRGFTLIEVMIVTAIMGILAAIAYPSYGQYVLESRRSDAHLSLLAASQAMERCKSTLYSYANCNLTSTDSVEGNYTLSLETTASTFTITATANAAGPQSSDTDCQTITLDHLSTQGPRTETTPSVCWK